MGSCHPATHESQFSVEANPQSPTVNSGLVAPAAENMQQVQVISENASIQSRSLASDSSMESLRTPRVQSGIQEGDSNPGIPPFEIVSGESGSLMVIDHLRRTIIHLPTRKPMEEVLVKPGPKSLKSECPICKDELDKKDIDSCFLDCMHWYHHFCIRSWFNSGKAECPECRTRTDKLYRVSLESPKPTPPRQPAGPQQFDTDEGMV